MFTKTELNHLYRYGLSLTHNREQAFDLLKIGLEKYLYHIQFRDSPLNPQQLLCRMMKNNFLDLSKCQANGQADRQEKGEVIYLFKNELENLLVEDNELELILSSLNSDEREFLFLWGVEEYSLEKMSEKIRLSKGKLLSRLHRLKVRITNCQYKTNDCSKKGP